MRPHGGFCELAENTDPVVKDMQVSLELIRKLVDSVLTWYRMDDTERGLLTDAVNATEKLRCFYNRRLEEKCIIGRATPSGCAITEGKDEVPRR